MRKTLTLLIIVFLIGIVFCPAIFSQEVIVDYEKESIPILNEELRRLRERTRYVEDNLDPTIDLTSDVTGILPLANGGTGEALVDPDADRIGFWDDSEGELTWLTPGTNLSISGTSLNASGTSLAGLTDVVFTWSGAETFTDSIDPATGESDNGDDGALYNSAGTYSRMLSFYYKHSDDITSLKVYARIKYGVDTNPGGLKVTINDTLSEELVPTGSSYAWESDSITVSTLTDGSFYEGKIELKGAGEIVDTYYGSACSAITIIAE